MPEGTDNTAAEIRGQVVELIATKTASWESNADPGHRHYWMGETLADALAEAGLLPTRPDYRWVYEPDGTPLGYRERSLLTDWREVPAPCPGCGTTERSCGRWRDAQRRCCADCRHPLREVPE
jgi:hypothetical protein